MVLFITGICRRTCWYCPLSRERKGNDHIYANERRITSSEEAIVVAQRMSALGTGITGGEPLERLDRVLEYARALKQAFGEKHHIHLYTGRSLSDTVLQNLTGLVDEIRMHPPVEYWDCIGETDFISAARHARKLGFEIGFEVPALPEIGYLEVALSELDFLNINELEWGEANAPEMRSRNLQLEDSVHNAVAGSRDWAFSVSLHEKVWFCSSTFKDSVQLRKRLLRIARNTARPFDEVTEDGTVIYGLVEKVRAVPSVLRDYGQDMYIIQDGAIETAWWILVKEREGIGGEKSLIERYPDRGFIVEVIPVP
jgi:hypothetical protein